MDSFIGRALLDSYKPVPMGRDFVVMAQEELKDELCNIQKTYNSMYKSITGAGVKTLGGKQPKMEIEQHVLAVLAAVDKHVIESPNIEEWSWSHMNKQMTFNRMHMETPLQLCSGTGTHRTCMCDEFPTPGRLGIALSLAEEYAWLETGAQPLGPRLCVLCQLYLIKSINTYVMVGSAPPPKFNYQTFYNTTEKIGGYKLSCCLGVNAETRLQAPVLDIDVSKLKVVRTQAGETIINQDPFMYKPFQ